MYPQEACQIVGDDLLKADGMDQACLGYAYVWLKHDRESVLVYSVPKILEILRLQGMDEVEAMEHFFTNIEGAYMGDKTPVFVYTEEV